MPADVSLNFAWSTQLVGLALPRPWAGGRGLGVEGVWSFSVFTPDPTSTAAREMIVFGTSPRQFTGMDQCSVYVGTAGLVERAWGTVLDVVDGNSGNVHVEESDWGEVLGVGLTSERRDITVRCRLPRGVAEPRRGSLFRARFRVWVVLEVSTHFSNRTVTELTVTGGRWEDLAGQVVENIPVSLSGFGS